MKKDNASEKVENVGRRQVLKTAAAVAAVVGSGVAVAADHSSHMEHNHDMHSSNANNTDLVMAANHCVMMGDACLEHCVELFKSGDTSVANCADKVMEMLAMCASLSKMAAYNSSHLPKLAALCMAVCKDCKEECEKHAKHHEACKRCAESCGECIKACEKVAA